jgi:hypothetical protein
MQGGQMAEQALGPGGTLARRRAFFGLLDANGWGWAGVKAAVWFVLIIMLMAYLPDRALYATVQNTIDLGVSLKVFNPALDLTPISFCPASNRTVPCPAPAGTVLPWEPSPAQLLLPAPRADAAIVGAGLQTLLVGGTDGKAAQASVFATVIRPDGNIDAWSQGAALPAPRAQASAVFFSGVAYVIGGIDASGAPTDTVYAGTPDAATGKISSWTASADLKLPAPRAGASVVVAGDGIFLIGGMDGKGPVDTVWESALDAKSGKLKAWAPNASLASFDAAGAVQPAPRVHAIATLIGQNLFVWGGEDAAGPTTRVLRGEVSTAKDTLGQVTRWGSPTAGTAAQQDLPAAHVGAFGWIANGNLYYAGGDGSNGELTWAIPDATGNITGWKHLAASDLPPDLGLRDAAPIVSGSHAFLVGGRASAAPTTGTARADLAPKAPFFQLGLFYIVVPAMGIQGEVGQQLSYLAAAGVGTADFVLLLLIGYAFNHKERTRAFLHGLRSRRRRGA